MYGFSPLVSSWFFGGEFPLVLEYELYFIACLFIFMFLTFPPNRSLSWGMYLDEHRLTMAVAIAAVGFFWIQILVYGNFTRAFILAYTERTGVDIQGTVRFLFYPMTTILNGLVALFTLYLYVRTDRRNIVNISILICSIIMLVLLGSRNILLWSLSGVMAVFISNKRYQSIFLLVIFLYLFAVLFAYARNNGLVAYFAGIADGLYTPLLFEYFDPIVHEFGSSYRTFSSVYYGKDYLDNAPYGLLTSFFINQLPSFLKPSDFMTFTNYISLIYAPEGEGIGSSPMTEAHLSNMLSIFGFLVVLVAVYWPAYYSRRYPELRLFTYLLVIAVGFNIWRIGSAEIMKMFLSNVVVFILLARILGVKVFRLR